VGTACVLAALASVGMEKATRASTATRTAERLMAFMVHHSFLGSNRRNLPTRYLSAARPSRLRACLHGILGRCLRL
jgi:hypothetical protein